MILHPAKTKSGLLATRQKHQLRPLHISLSLKDSHTEQVHEHRHLVDAEGSDDDEGGVDAEVGDAAEGGDDAEDGWCRCLRWCRC